MSPPPDLVRSAFAVAGEVPQQISQGHGRSYRCGEVVLTRVADAAEAAYLAGVSETLMVSQVRLARPLRSSDGRWVVGGWTAHRYVSGRPSPRWDDIIAVGERFHDAVAPLERPRFLDQRDDLASWADRVAWGDEPVDPDQLGNGQAASLFADLASCRTSLAMPHQLVHADLARNVLFAGTAPPAVVNIAPYWRPTLWATGVVVVDAIAWGGADLSLAERAEAQWSQVLLRALLFRLAVSLAEPTSPPVSIVGVLSAAERLRAWW